MEKNKLRILAIDDNKDNLISVKALIKEAFPDSITLTAENGSVGLELAQAEDPAVILLDVVMPGMDGFEVCRRLKSNPETGDIPVVFLTALKGDKESRIRALEVGAEAFLAKPIDETELTAQIKAMQKIKEANSRKRAEKAHLAQIVDEQTRELAQAHTAALKILDDLKKENKARKKNEAALRESEGKHRSMIANISDVIAIMADDGALRYKSPNIEKWFGWQPEDLVGTDGWATVHPDDRELMQREFLALLEKDNAEKTVEYRYLCKDGNYKLIELTAVNLTNDPMIKGVLMNYHDITERKQAEQALAAEKERLAVTLRSIGDGVITANVEGNIDVMNKVAEKLTGWTQNEAKGKPLPEVFAIINDLTRQPDEDIAAQVLSSGEIIERPNHTHLISRQGTERVIADSAAPIKDKENRTIGVVLVFRDMTERQKLQEMIQRTAKLDSVGVLAGGIAHDFNNLLTGLFGNLEMAKTFLPEDHRSYRFLKSAVASMERATNLTKQLLTFAKGGDPVKETLAIGGVIASTAQFSMRGSKVSLQCHIPPDLWPVGADKGQLSQVISNLVINAQQAMLNGGVITLTAANIETAEGRQVEITVQDEGVGIAPQNLDKIFDPYFSTKKEGSGLGLASTHSIISKHNGKITVESKLNQGTRFTIHLPAAEAVTERMMAGELPGETVSAPVPAVRILVMDDDEAIRELAGEILEALGHTVSYAVHGQEALEKYRETYQTGSAYDAVIVDLTVPGGMGGQTLAQEILKLDPQAKIIVSSGYATASVLANYESYGFKGRVTKPYGIADLQKVIRQVLKA